MPAAPAGRFEEPWKRLLGREAAAVGAIDELAAVIRDADGAPDEIGVPAVSEEDMAADLARAVFSILIVFQ